MTEEAILAFRRDFEAIEQEIGKAIIGQKTLIRDVLTAMVAGGNVLLEGLPGLGKTQLVKTIGKVLDLQFSRIQYGEGMRMEFRQGPVFSNIVLADEINRATPKTQSALLEAMQEHTVTGGSTTYALPEPFFVLATQNPLESEGTYPLPEAQMDRFLFKLDVGFPNKEELLKIVMMTTTEDQQEPQKVCDGAKLLELRRIAQTVPIAEPVADYMMEVTLKTHPEYEGAPEDVKKYIRYGASPRGAQAVMQAARILALTEGRYNVSYEDVRAAAKPALRHRLFLNFEGIAEGKTVDGIIEALL